MNDTHITEILDNVPAGKLSAAEQATIRAHIDACADCRRAFAAAQISGLLMQERTSEAARQTLEANPFFQTRVLAAWREQQSGNGWSLKRWWQSAGALMASMAATTAVLAVLTLVIPTAESTSPPTASVIPTSAESVMLDQGQEGVTDDQVLSAIYGDDFEGK